jgi:hypothetical protein
MNTDELADCHTLQMKLDGSDVRDLGAMEDTEFSADGSWMAYTQQTATGRIIGLRQQAGMETRLLGAGTRPFFSPDSKQLFFYRNYPISNDGKSVEMLVRYIIRGKDAGHLYEPEPEERVASERDAHFTRDGKHLLLIRYTKNYLKNNIGGLAPVTPLPTVGLFLASPDLAHQQLIYRTNKDDELEFCQQQGKNYLVFAWQSKYFILSAPNYNLPTPIDWLYDNNCRLTPDGNQILLTKKPE